MGRVGWLVKPCKSRKWYVITGEKLCIRRGAGGMVNHVKPKTDCTYAHASSFCFKCVTCQTAWFHVPVRGAGQGGVRVAI
jgi:hypothetical protein